MTGLAEERCAHAEQPCQFGCARKERSLEHEHARADVLAAIAAAAAHHDPDHYGQPRKLEIPRYNGLKITGTQI